MAIKHGIKIGIVGNRLVPFNEAYANQMRVLSEELDARVITCNDIGWIPFRRMGRYFVINTKFLMKRTLVLSFINGLFFYIFVKLYERKFDVILLSAGVESEFLNYLNFKKCIPILSTIDDEAKAKKFASEVAPKLKRIMVQSKRIEDELISYGVDSDKIRFMYPIVDFKKFRYTDPPSPDNFKILFASAPNVEDLAENNFEAKGVPLLLESFKEFVNNHEAMLYIIWRDKYNKELGEIIKELGLEDCVRVVNKVVNMEEGYAKTHITVIPYTSGWRSPQYPLSALESLACGRPVVTTDVIELAELIREYGCGCVVKPLKNNLVRALEECRENYLNHQKRCKETYEKLFRANLDRFKELFYESSSNI